MEYLDKQNVNGQAKKRNGRRQLNEEDSKQSVHTRARPGRQLPIRSKNIDLSQYLAKLNLNGSEASSGQGKSQQNCKPAISLRCTFCEKNGESREIYMSHNLKDSMGKVVCPILSSYVCPKCGESGDYAHTDKYCRVTQRKQKENKIKRFFSQSGHV